MPLTFLSTFAGVGGFDLGLERADWQCVGQVEIDPYCLKVLAKHWPEVERHNDIRTAKEWWLSAPSRPKVDAVTAGFPCQDVSIAGRRAGLGNVSDAVRTRTGLFFDLIEFIAAVRPRAFLLENVPGLLTSNKGADFAVVLDALAEVGFVDIEWRVLDSQYFGVAQRRRRLFIVGRTGASRGGSVLLEPDGSTGAADPLRAAGPQVAPSPAPGAGVRLALDPSDPDDIAAGRLTGPLQAQGTTGGFRFDADGAGAGHIIPLAPDRPAKRVVRRLTPTECERLQGFPDGWTLL